MPRISYDNPFYFLTAVTHMRLEVFRTERLKSILTAAFDEARSSAGIEIFAYVVMANHYHVITDSSKKPSEVLRYLNGISARRVIDHLKENGHESSLAKLRKEESRKEYKYSLWEHHTNKFFIATEPKLIEKANYIHFNPVEEGLASAPGDYRFSSFRYWANKPLLEDEPLKVDVRDIGWKGIRE
jgi:putative transposase